jgi:fumarate reductase subunit D
MASLHGKIKNALDEARILILGAQVLLGFQYRAFFEPGFEKLGRGERALELIGLFALLATAGALFLPAARHRIVEHGYDTGRFHRFIMLVMRAALFPFAVGLSVDLAVVGNRIGGPLGGALCGALTALAALGLWYGHFARSDRRQRQEPEDSMEDTPLPDRIVQVLTEARVVLPGAQALLGFQLAMVLMDAFAKLPQGVQIVHLFSLGLVALATIVLMAPAAYHRIVERGEDTERFHRFASRMVLLALALLAPGFCGDLYVVLRRAGFERLALPVAAGMLLVFYLAWFGSTLLLRRTAPPELKAKRL